MVIHNSRFERNSGFMSTNEMDLLTTSTVSIAGAGGDGGMLAVQLARLGVGSFKLADPDPFEIENINRQAVCTDKTIGVNKAHAVAAYVRDINPSIEVEVFDDGITRENAAAFVEGSTLLVDETEFTLQALGVMLAREARKRDIPTLTALNIGFGAMVTTFRPNGTTLEKVLGFKEDQSIEEISKAEVALDRWLPYLPRYVDLKVFGKVASGEKSAPSIAPGVALAAGIGSTQALLNIFEGENNRPDPVYAPKALVVDAMSMQSKQVKFSRLSHYKHLAGIGVRNALKLHPQASY